MWNRSFETTNSNNKQKKNHIDNVCNPVNITIYCQPKYEYISQILKKSPYILNHRKKIHTTNKQKKIKPNKMYDLSHFISVLSIVRHLFRPNKYLLIFERSNYMMGTSYSTARRFRITENLFILKNRMQYRVCISVITFIFNQTLRYFLTTRFGNVSTFNLYCNN